MIDFRYHLVSIVSIFLALAVGIVLGAGPLQQGITSTVSQELSTLRQDKSDLRSQLQAEANAAQARDAFTAAANPTLVANALVGRSVSLVLLPGADAGLAKSTATLLDAAGAQVTSTTTIHDSWVSTDQQKAADRQQLADRLATSLGADAAAADGSSLDAVLARLLVHKPVNAQSGQVVAPEPAEVTAAVADLTKADLLEVDVQTPIPAQLSVVIAANSASGSSDADKAATVAYATLVKALDRGGSGTVLASNVGVTGAQDGLSTVSQLRADADAVKAVSTVDDAGLPMGQASIVFALDGQLAGGAGQYGLAGGVTAPFAPLPAP